MVTSVKYIVQVQHCRRSIATLQHIYRQEMMMFTTKFFNGFLSFARTAKDTDLQAWAKIEYKQDADYAFHYMKEHGFAPMGANQ